MIQNNEYEIEAVLGDKLWMRCLLLLTALFIWSGSFAADQVTFIHTDLYGSPVAATNDSAEVVWRAQHTPYGEEVLRSDFPRDSVGFTGHLFDNQTELSYFQARTYDPAVGRFMGVDPEGLTESDIQTFNKYAYASNNPFRYVDPDGRAVETIAIDIPSLVVSVGYFMDEPSIGNAVGVLLDGAAVIAPGVPGGVGLVRKGAGKVTNKPLLGKNPKIKKDRTLTDLDPVHDRATAKSIFRNQTKGQNVRQFQNKKGDIIRRSDDGTQIRMNPDSTTRLDLPGRGTQPNGETVHFNP